MFMGIHVWEITMDSSIITITGPTVNESDAGSLHLDKRPVSPIISWHSQRHLLFWGLSRGRAGELVSPP